RLEASRIGSLSSFGQGANGSLYAVSLDGGLYRLPERRRGRPPPARPRGGSSRLPPPPPPPPRARAPRAPPRPPRPPPGGAGRAARRGLDAFRLRRGPSQRRADANWNHGGKRAQPAQAARRA